MGGSILFDGDAARKKTVGDRGQKDGGKIFQPYKRTNMKQCDKAGRLTNGQILGEN